MQDRFKFRFWDKETKTMQKIPTVELRHRVTLDKIFNDDRVIFMQCTGLKDKDGWLIYEGDVVSDGFDKYVVEWCEYNVQFEFRDLSEEFKVVYTIEQLMPLEVVGNIYENPELLKGDD